MMLYTWMALPLANSVHADSGADPENIVWAGYEQR